MAAVKAADRVEAVLAVQAEAEAGTMRIAVADQIISADHRAVAQAVAVVAVRSIAILTTTYRSNHARAQG